MKNLMGGRVGILKKLTIIFVLLNFIQNTYGIDLGFSTYSDIGIGYNVNNNSFETQAVIGGLDWVEKNLKFGFNITLLKLEFTHNTYMKYSFLPIEIYYRPLKFGNIFYGTIYGRSEWQFKNSHDEGVNPTGEETENYFLGTMGLKFLIMPNMWEDILPYYSPHISLFFEYNTLNQFKIGLSIDILGWLMLAMNGIIIMP
jgi:hypothetical protein